MSETAHQESVQQLASLYKLNNNLSEAKNFNSGCQIFLAALMDFIDIRLSSGSYAMDTHVRRGMIHRRSNKGYDALVSLDRASDNAHWLRPSTSAWRWLETSGKTIAIDLTTGIICWPGEPNKEDIRTENEMQASSETQYRMLDRDTTHLLALPFQEEASQNTGMISVEVTCRPAIGDLNFWDACIEYCELLTNFAAPRIINLPRTTDYVSDYEDNFLPVVGRKMQQMLQFIKPFAGQRETLLISGPSGAGKTRLARWCHEQSPVNHSIFETVDLLAVPDDMQLPELTGWKRGSFTGALHDYTGALERAEGGTLLIDELDKLSLKAQAGLLQILESGEYRPLGSSGVARQANVRFIVGTNVDLSEEVKAKRFRQDLFYRINVLPVSLPGLEERVDEIGSWANYMVQQHHEKYGNANTSPCKVAASASLRLGQQSWPGNLRQLNNVIRRAYSIAASTQNAQTEIIIRLDDINKALSLDGNEKPSDLLSALTLAATAFVDEAMKSKHQHVQLKLEHTQAFTGLVLQTAINRLETRKAAYLLFGREAQIENRNYNREIKRALDQLQLLLDYMGIDARDVLTQNEPYN
ncbi:MAG: sigma 54-interacting transcriptional regulator [Pseudomonadales bacterium]|nr:sigma 54-interacting transcriptional regulator [Pseudomonadales bacterium]